MNCLIIRLLSASPVGEARLPMPKGMAYKDLLLLLLLLLLMTVNDDEDDDAVVREHQ
jgi:hypothetical protein